jgi:hypothetical protein
MLSVTMKRLLLTLLLAANLYAEDQVQWATEYGSFAHMGGVTMLNDGSIVLAYTSTPCEKVSAAPSEYSPNQLALVKLDSDGNVLFNVDISRPAELLKDTAHKPVYGTIDGLVALDDGDFIVVAEFPEGYPWLLRLDATGHARFAKSLRASRQNSGRRIGDVVITGHADSDKAPSANRQDPRRTIIGIVVTSDGNIAVGGGAGDDFLVAKYTPNGALQWEKIINGGGIDVITGLAADDRGGVVAVGMTFPKENASDAPPMIVLHIDKNGVVGAKRDFHGEFPHVAISRGMIGVSYSRDNGEKVVWLKILDGSLGEVTEVGFDTTVDGQTVAAANDGTFVVFWTRGGSFIDRIGVHGERLGEIAGFGTKYAGAARMVVGDRALYVAWEDPNAKVNGQSCRVVRLARLAPATIPAKSQP